MAKQIHIIAGPNGAGKTYFNFIKKAQACGYKVNLFFLKLESTKLAQQRVLNRVSKGGHSIEPEVIKRRFQRGLNNLKDYQKLWENLCAAMKS